MIVNHLAIFKLLSWCLLVIIVITYIRLFKEASDTDMLGSYQTKQNKSKKLISDQMFASKNISGYNLYETMLMLERELQDSKEGENGSAVILSDEKQMNAAKDNMAANGINLVASRILKYTRTLLDHRNPFCSELSYDINHLPTADVVIAFYNAPYSILLRTIHRVLATCPDRLLHKIILVDDASTDEELKGKFDHYLDTRLPARKLRLARLKRR